MGSSQFINREIEMYFLSVWLIMAWHHISPGVTVKVFNMCCISNAVNETDDMLWTGRDCEGGDSDADW